MIHSACGKEIKEFTLRLNVKSYESYGFVDGDEDFPTDIDHENEVQLFELAIHDDGCHQDMNAEETLWAIRLTYMIEDRDDPSVAHLFTNQISA